MKKPYHQDLGQILDTSQKLKFVVQQAKLLGKLNKAILAVLPSDLAAYCQVVNLQQNTLIIAAESAAWATTLRYQCPALLTALRDVAPGIANIKVTVQPNEYKSLPEKPALRHIPPHIAEQLKSCAASIKNPGLKKALENLAQPSNPSD